MLTMHVKMDRHYDGLSHQEQLDFIREKIGEYEDTLKIKYAGHIASEADLYRATALVFSHDDVEIHESMFLLSSQDFIHELSFEIFIPANMITKHEPIRIY